ncbi:uncharacterized protein LOC125232943 [Leguminivora glycinivorella]|uniref:uncharacterized protein LOC125232940 n=1 Tax=Leguminivora glycinivorella TaxID=1035111 RepID=UPI00200F7183|nr:uncharacterized protein LOC125232940 [Leguminivora glycinivorella]XP_047994751.1 uncharacterized protein LOC125232943 [Leguminivora glycinivorella]
MKTLLVLFALAAVGSASIWKGGYRIRFDIGVIFGRSFFFDIPRTLSEAVSERWVQRTPPLGLPVTSVTMYCYSDNVVCNFYDSNGDVAGLQIGLNKNKFTPHFDNMEDAGFTTWTVNGVDYWTIQQYFTTEEILSSRVASPTRRENENKVTENGGVWVVGPHKEVVHISNSTSTIADEGLFTRQACIPWMGRHYYYRMTEDLSCTDEPLFPWFGLVDSGELVATGFVIPGKLNLDRNSRDWFEHPESAAVKAIVPDGPECLYNLASSPGLVTMHVYYIDQPWLISCVFQ